jgi:hypothetical protein
MRKLVNGLLAGAAGTAALDAATYLDMAMRGRPASTTPARSVRQLARRARIDLGTGERADNRANGLGALLGYATGAGVGATYVLAVGHRLPWPVSAVVLALGAMVAANAPMTAMKVTDPRTWSAADWAADVAPHAAYGTVTAIALDRLASEP